MSTSTSASLGPGMPHFHADDDWPVDVAWLGGVVLLQDHLDFLAAGLVQDLAERRVVGQVQRERLERFVHRLLAVVADGGYLAVAEVGQDEALEKIVHVADGKVRSTRVLPSTRLRAGNSRRRC